MSNFEIDFPDACESLSATDETVFLSANKFPLPANCEAKTLHFRFPQSLYR
jgi:pyridoxal biosynthesis lyase PdxS